MPKGDYVREDNLPHRYDATTANALENAARKEDGEVMGDTAEDAACSEEKEGGEEELLPAEYIGEGGYEGLEDGACEEVG